VTVLSFRRCTAGSALAAFLAAAPFQIGRAAIQRSAIDEYERIRQLPCCTTCGSAAGCRVGGGLLPGGAQARSKQAELLDRAFLSFLVDGDVDEAVKFAERVAQADKNDRVARLVLGVNALKRKQYGSAKRDLAQSIRGPITDLTASLLSAWSTFAPTTARERSRQLITWPGRTGTRSSRTCMPV
jgi:hypothetical protein